MKLGAVLVVLFSSLGIAAPSPAIARLARRVNTKRGVSFNNPSTHIAHFNIPGSKVSWAYNWGSSMPADFPTSFMNYAPMLWSDASKFTSNWAANIKNAHQRGSNILLGFNEPDMCAWGSACMDPVKAARSFKKYLVPHAEFKLISPAVTSRPEGKQWMTKFLAACNGGCRLHGLAVHWYGSATDSNGLKAFLTDIHNTWPQYPIWLTEFHGTGSEANQISFFKKVVPWMDAQPWISHYAPFWAVPKGKYIDTAGVPSGLVDEKGNPNNLGAAYATA